MTIEEAVAHLGGRIGDVPPDVRERVRDELPHYLWVMTDLDSRRRRYVVCEWCEDMRTEVRTGSRWTHAYKQGEVMTCPYCGGDVTVKRMGRGYGNIYDRVNVVWYQRSAVDPNAVVAVAAHVFRDFDRADERPWQNDPWISFRSFTVIVPGEGAYRFKRQVTHWALVGGNHAVWQPDGIRWIPVKRFRNLTFGSESGGPFVRMNPLRAVVLDDTLQTAIAGTTLARGWSDEYFDDDSGGSVALGLIAKYPCVEYMTKLGMTELVKAKAAGDLPRDLVNWRGRSMAKVLKLDRGRLGELKHAGIAVTPALLVLYRWMDGAGYRLTANAAHNVAVLAERWTRTDNVGGAVGNTISYHDAGRRQRALKYIARQCERCGDTRLHLGDFMDYWRACERFGENLNDDAVAFPSNIREAEARMRERERREDRERREVMNGSKERQDEKIRSQYKRLLRDYGFSFGGLTLRPARDGDEVRAEGKALHHCVGGYVGSYAAGKTVICVLRRDVEPERPWRTVEINTAGRLVQDRGYHNDTSLGTPLTPEYRAMLDLFWAAWRERKKERKTA